ncbi:hypothetical protein LTR36_009914 [Oleoguttula mirabilis]|uniref:Uncharacterized protein n=1 Tax=Oleoguttula mirabilis TaxID=1507867 RepID=A0AAV9J5C9_9PEZI|nr:hypothetical protein LTR36_009914 [Oleoguttula mirabilis]
MSGLNGLKGFLREAQGSATPSHFQSRDLSNPLRQTPLFGNRKSTVHVLVAAVCWLDEASENAWNDERFLESVLRSLGFDRCAEPSRTNARLYLIKELKRALHVVSCWLRQIGWVDSTGTIQITPEVRCIRDDAQGLPFRPQPAQPYWEGLTEPQLYDLQWTHLLPAGFATVEALRDAQDVDPEDQQPDQEVSPPPPRSRADAPCRSPATGPAKRAAAGPYPEALPLIYGLSLASARPTSVEGWRARADNVEVQRALDLLTIDETRLADAFRERSKQQVIVNKVRADYVELCSIDMKLCAMFLAEMVPEDKATGRELFMRERGTTEREYAIWLRIYEVLRQELEARLFYLREVDVLEAYEADIHTLSIHVGQRTVAHQKADNSRALGALRRA